MKVHVSNLNKTELEAHDFYITALGKLVDLPANSRRKVFNRLKMLRILNLHEEQVLLDQLIRITQEDGE
jgi:hypothetical protein